jgi:hypothetical protein
MRIGRGNRSTRRKRTLVPVCSPQIPYDLTWDLTRAAAVGTRRLTASTMTRPLGGHSSGHSEQESVYVHVSYSERFPR